MLGLLRATTDDGNVVKGFQSSIGVLQDLRKAIGNGDLTIFGLGRGVRGVSQRCECKLTRLRTNGSG